MNIRGTMKWNVYSVIKTIIELEIGRVRSKLSVSCNTSSGVHVDYFKWLLAQIHQQSNTVAATNKITHINANANATESPAPPVSLQTMDE